MCWEKEDQYKGNCTDHALGVMGSDAYEWAYTIPLDRWFGAEVGANIKDFPRFKQITFEYFTRLADEGVIDPLSKEDHEKFRQEFYDYWRI